MIKKFSEYMRLNEGQSDFDTAEEFVQDIWRGEESKAKKIALTKIKKYLEGELIGNTTDLGDNTSDVIDSPIKKLLNVEFRHDMDSSLVLKVKVELENGKKDEITYNL